MRREKRVKIRKFELSDIPNKVRWINNPQVNQFLHYNLPLEVEKTKQWFLDNQNREDRFDAIIEVNNVAVGLIGLLSIDKNKSKAEYYITLGEPDYFGKGIATLASKEILKYAFDQLHINLVYLYTECANQSAIRLYERIGFHRVCLLKDCEMSNGKQVNCFYYELFRACYEQLAYSPTMFLEEYQTNKVYIKREDLLPYSFGGNKARKAKYFFNEIDTGNYDCVVTYGSSSSNHCRVISNMAAQRNLPCYIITPKENFKLTHNRKMIALLGANDIIVPVDEVHDTIEKMLNNLSCQGHHPYFIAGGGHGNLGTQAYVDCYYGIKSFEENENIHFDYIFLASGTGTTQAGLICGQLMSGDMRKIIGISIARRELYGRQIIIDSIYDYLAERKVEIDDERIEAATVFNDNFIGSGYALNDRDIYQDILEAFVQHGVPLDSTYSGKAYYGMRKYLHEKKIFNQNILFIHTGGTPLFFDDLQSME